MKGRRFYKDGIRFECQKEGNCCLTRGRYGYVYLSFGDQKRLAEHFHLTVQEFNARYTRTSDGMRELRYTDKDCPFFEKQRCVVYQARPWQCRTWPFWPENMDQSVWEKEVTPYCPGVNRGKLYSADEIEEILKKRKDIA